MWEAAGIEIRYIYIVFAHFEALSLDSQILRSIPSDKNAYEITLQSSDRARSEVHPLGDFWGTFGPQDEPPDNPQMTQMTPR